MHGERTMKKNLKVWGMAMLAASGFAALAVAGISNAAAPINVQAVEGPALKQAINSHKGKVVVLNLWATWCPPCVEEFPDLVKLHNNYRAKGLVMIAASLDEPEDKGKVVEFVSKQKASFPVYLRSKGNEEAFINPIDKEWPGAVPVTYVYNRAGKLVGKPIVGGQSYEQFEERVKQAMAN
jgi:thiol-disulfide isomerase/thioredoxin